MIWEMRGMLIISIFELVLVLFAMSWDFASGYYKAKLRGEDRNSYGMRRTVSKFILYAGSVCIAWSIDAVCYVCKFWEFIHFSFLTEIRSIWEKADAKQLRQAAKSAALIGSVLNKDMLKDAFTEALITAKEKENKNEKE